jgi:two-component sensor histidine kinase
MHRAANLQHLASNLERLLDSGRIDVSNRPRTIRRAKALVSAYRSLDGMDGAHLDSCEQELKEIASGLVEIFGHTVGSLVLSLELQPVPLTGEARRALLLAASELVVNTLRHAFTGRQTGIIEITLCHVPAHHEGTLIVADDGVGLGDGAANGTGLGRTIVCELAGVLGGEVFWRPSLHLGGTEAVLNFPVAAWVY